MSGDFSAPDEPPTRRAVLTAGVIVAGLAAGIETAIALAPKTRAAAPPAEAAAAPSAAPSIVALPPSLSAPPTPDVEFRAAAPSSMQCFVQVPETGEWFTTQAMPGTSGLLDPNELAVGDLVVSRMAADGTLLDSMSLVDGGHGMGLVVRVESGVTVLYTCWFAAGPSGSLYDVVRLPWVSGIADRAAATTVIAGAGYPVDPIYDVSTNAVTVRHQGGGGPEYTRHSWDDFAAGDLSRPTGAVPTTDRPPVHQGFCSLGDRFYFLTGASTLEPAGGPAQILEYDWRTGQQIGAPVDASGNARQADGTYPGGSMEPEGASIVRDSGGAAALVVGVTTGALPDSGGRKGNRTFRYPLTLS